MARTSNLSITSSQRNVYLTGFTLFLSLVLTRTFYIILDLIHTQEEYAKLKQETAGKSRSAGSGAGASDQKTIEELKKKLAESEKKERDFGPSLFSSFYSPQIFLPLLHQ